MYTRAQTQLAPPLNLPNGSVRAAMALILSITLWIVVLRNGSPPSPLVNATTLVVIFYFAVRITAHPPILPQELHKHRYLHLSIRLFLLVGFFTIVSYLITQGQSTPSSLGYILSTLEGYTLGFVANLIIHRIHHDKPLPTLQIWRHGKAALILTFTAVVCLMFIFGRPSWIPLSTESLLGPVVAFYFGSRPQ